MSLSPLEIERYREEGYLMFPALIRGKKLARYKGIFDELVERSRSMQTSEGGYSLAPDENGKPVPGRLHKIQGVCVVDERVLDLAREEAILDRAASLIGPDLDVFGTKFFPMLVRGATSTGWHQDNHYFGTNSDRVLSCAIYLEETDRENGCLQVVPGSHRTGDLAEHTFGSGVMAHGEWVDVDESRAVDIICPGGTVVFFSANLLHGALPNTSDRTGYRTAWHYIPGDLNLAMFPRGGYRDRHIVRGK